MAKISEDLIEFHVDRILAIDVGDRYAVEACEGPDVVDALKERPLGGRKFITYRGVVSSRLTFLRDYDAAPGARERDLRILEEQRNFQALRALSLDLTDRALAYLEESIKKAGTDGED